MAAIFPFRALRPRLGLAAQVACPPYDVISRDEARHLVEGNPHSFLRVNRADLELDSEIDPHSNRVYERARENLTRLVQENVLVKDEKPTFSLYRMTWCGHSQTGLVTLLSLEDYETGRVKKHELTRRDKVLDRADHMEALGAQVGPVLSAFRDRDDIRRLFAELTESPPSIDFLADDEVRHEIWVIEEEGSMTALKEAFSRLDAIYIADGHHRSEASAEVAQRIRRRQPSGSNLAHGSFLNVVFPASELTILPYHRVVARIPGSIEEILEAARKCFAIEPVDSLGESLLPPHRFGIYHDGIWRQLTALAGTFDPDHPIRSIDTCILADGFLRPCLGVEDERTDERIQFVGGRDSVKRLEALVDDGNYELAIALPPTTMDQLLTVADRGESMPPKSTWFAPKLRSGLVVRQLTP